MTPLLEEKTQVNGGRAGFLRHIPSEKGEFPVKSHIFTETPLCDKQWEGCDNTRRDGRDPSSADQ